MSVKKIRELNNLTQKEFAKKCGLSIHTIRSYEQKKRNPSINNSKKIAKIFGCSINEIREDINE